MLRIRPRRAAGPSRCRPFFALIAAGAVALACNDSTGPQPDQLYTRYVAIGGSTAAGIQAGGLTSESQIQAYPVLLADVNHLSFHVPTVAAPGCPPPMTSPLTPSGLHNAACTVTRPAPPMRSARTLALPESRLGDALHANAQNRWQTAMFGARSQVELALLADPTLLTVHFGDDMLMNVAALGILGPSTPGGDSLLQPLAEFTEQYEAVLAPFANEPTLRGGVLIGLLDPVVTMPLLQPGAYWFLARDPATGQFQGKAVNTNCSPVTNLGQPNPLSANLVSWRILRDNAVHEINCDPAALGAESRYLLTIQEMALLRTRVTQYNAALQALATERDWLFYDPNTDVLARALEVDGNGRYQSLRKCQLLPTATTAAQFMTAVLNSCPVTGPSGAPGFFGTLISFDGMMPSAQLHLMMRDRLRDLIRDRFGPTVD